VQEFLTRLISVIALFTVMATGARSQDCVPPDLIPTSKADNIFSPEQEMILGDLTYERMARDMRFVNDPQLLSYLNAIGEKLIQHLPPTGIKFKFFIVDIPEANAFDVAGGYIFISRKLIAFANNEDELAAVMAHELGHGVVRHGAIGFSELFRKILNVTRVGDRKDIAEKYNLLIERRRTKKISLDEDTEHQLQADRVGLYALTAAGYDPNAFGSFFDRLVETKGKTGNWFTDLFGQPRPEQKRLREMIRITEQLPATCRETRRADATQDFLKWQAEVVAYHETNKHEDLPGLLWKKDLSPKLRSDISHFAFSSDGKYFLAQDDFAITVIQRDPLQIVFQIPALEADHAWFTPDGKFVVFGTASLRYEKWSIAEQQPVQIRELVVRRDCWEHSFSPDGKYLACVDYSLNLNVLDTQTGKKIYEKKDFYKLSLWEFLNWIATDTTAVDREQKRFFNMQFSPDSEFLVIARTSRFRFRFKVAALSEESQDTLLALDMATLMPIKTGDDLKKVTRRAFIFIDAKQILGMAASSIEDSGIFSFPEGKRLAKFTFGAEEIERTGNPNCVIVKPLSNAKLGIFDLAKSKLVMASDKHDVNMWGDLMVFESIAGKVALAATHYDENKKSLDSDTLSTIDIPVGPIGQLYAADLSGNLQWLAVSTNSRGALWNLVSGEQRVLVRGFRGVLVADDGAGIAEFPKQDSTRRGLAFLNPLAKEARPLRDIPETGVHQYREFLLIRRTLKESENKATEQNQSQNEAAPEASLAREVRFELRSVINDKVVWSREFPKEAPHYFFDIYSGRLILYWTLGSDVGKARLKEDSALAERAKELSNIDDDYLIEVVDAFAAKTVGTLLLDTGKHSFYLRSAVSEGNWLVLNDSQNRVLVYSLKDSDLRYRFFGANAAISPTESRIVVENYPGELIFYNLTSGEKEGRLMLSKPAAFARFSLDGRKLFVLSKEQTAYAFEVEKAITKVSAGLP
jgi:hypothetical protein